MSLSNFFEWIDGPRKPLLYLACVYYLLSDFSRTRMSTTAFGMFLMVFSGVTLVSLVMLHKTPCLLINCYVFNDVNILIFFVILYIFYIIKNIFF